jgi:hypothetical protein
MYARDKVNPVRATGKKMAKKSVNVLSLSEIAAKLLNEGVWKYKKESLEKFFERASETIDYSSQDEEDELTWRRQFAKYIPQWGVVYLWGWCECPDEGECVHYEEILVISEIHNA